MFLRKLKAKLRNTLAKKYFEEQIEVLKEAALIDSKQHLLESCQNNTLSDEQDSAFRKAFDASCDKLEDSIKASETKLALKIERLCRTEQKLFNEVSFKTDMLRHLLKDAKRRVDYRTTIKKSYYNNKVLQMIHLERQYQNSKRNSKRKA